MTHTAKEGDAGVAAAILPAGDGDHASPPADQHFLPPVSGRSRILICIIICTGHPLSRTLQDTDRRSHLKRVRRLSLSHDGAIASDLLLPRGGHLRSFSRSFRSLYLTAADG